MTATFVACLTPPGVAAIATLALRGPAAWDLVRELSERELPALPEPGRFWLTRLGCRNGGEADEVVVAVKQTKPEIWLELHVHGGREVVAFLQGLFTSRGARTTGWEQLEASSAGHRLQIAALGVLTKALTVRTAAIALDQYHGALVKALHATRAALRRGDVLAAKQVLTDLDRHAAVGRHLVAPWRVVLAGAANVGKSSLVNALAGYQRSIVSPIAGTTRDVVTTLLALDGWPVEVADVAGFDDTRLGRRTADSVESEGIARARAAAKQADLCLWLVDTSTAPAWPDGNLGPVRLILSKCDLPPAWSIAGVDALAVSAFTGAGLGELCQQIADWLVPLAPPPGAAVPFTPDLANQIAEIAVFANTGNLPEAEAKLEQLCCQS